MSSRSPRVVTALLLALSLWMSAVGAVAAPPQQPQEQKQTESQKGSQDQKSSANPVPQGSGRPLSVDEDPSMIGKRNINKSVVNKVSMAIAKINGVSSNDVAVGRQVAAEVDRQAKFIEDPVITEYVNRVGQNLVLHSDAKVPFTIKVIDSDEVNAFALPGGFFYVNKGLLLAADNEAEVAGVMAHEIAHVAARHAIENTAKANATWLGAMILGSVLGGAPAIIFQNTASLGLLATFLKFSRSAEEEADKLGVQYLYAAGYDPNAMATMFEKLEAKNNKKPGFISKAFSTHPQPPDRRAASIALASRFPEREEYILSTSEFQRVKSRLLRLSNARATTAGDISDTGNGAPGRPTLKRRQPTPDDSTTGPDGDDQKPPETRPSSPPKLKRNDGTNAPPASSQPDATP